jgi:multiple sugar transport system substrate-binding protein/raffinose/stachyose/melibiose transport system substrate-binding protein
MSSLRVGRRAVLASLSVLFTPAVLRAAPTNLTWFMWSGSEAEVAAWQHLCAMVHAKHPDITVNFQTASWTDYWTKLPALAASNQLPDIVSLQNMRTAGFAQLMEPLDPYIRADNFDVGAFDKSIIAGLSRNGKIYALPYDFGPWLMFYNRDQFQAAGLVAPDPGWTETEFLKDARALTKNGSYGTAVSVPDAFLSYASSAGASYLTPDGSLDLTNPGLEAAFQSYADLVARDKVAPLFPSSGTPGDLQANGRFVAGDVAMYADGPWDLINIGHSAKFRVGVVPIPAGKNGSVSLTAGSGFGIATTSRYKAEAWKAIQVLTSPQAEAYLAGLGRAFPARIAQQRDWYGIAARNVDSAQAAITAALQTGKPYLTTANWNTVSSLFGQYAPLAFGGRKSAGQVLTTIQQLAAES